MYTHDKLLDFTSSLFMFYTKTFCFVAICFVNGWDQLKITFLGWLRKFCDRLYSKGQWRGDTIES